MLKIIKKIIGLSIFIISIVMIFTEQSIALSADTHGVINVYIVDPSKGFSGYSLDEYLKNNLGISDGVTAKFDSKMVQEWIGYGGKQEDAGFRSINHFLNPIDNTGVGYSALIWATLPTASQDYSPFASWSDVRGYYFRALTSTDKTTREDYFALTFQGVGQIMHLVQDMSVPAHARNDEHPTIWLVKKGDPYEQWVEKNTDQETPFSTKYPAYDYPYSNAFFLIPQLFDSGQYPDIYNKLDPNITVSQKNIGLSEYTNANFLSKNNIFKDFDYPAYKPGISITENNETINGEEILYLKKIAEGEKINYFARAGRFYKKLPTEYKDLALMIDDEKVHNAYADLLIPRAVGYSSQVLKYFFRGQMDVKCLPVIEDDKMTYVELDIKNATPDEAMTNGKLMLTVKYTNSNNEEKLFKARYWNVSEGTTSEYATIQSLNPGESLNEVLFLFPENTQIPIDQWDSIKLTLTYQGKLGNEEGAVIGKVFNPGKLKFNEEWNNGLTGNNNWYHVADNYTDPNCANLTGYNTTSQSGTFLVKDNAATIGSYSLSCGTHFNKSLIYSGKDTHFPIPITPNTSIQFKVPQMTTNAPNPEWDYDGNWQIMEVWLTDGQYNYVFMFSLGEQFFYSPDPHVYYFTFDPGYMMVDSFESLFQLYGINMPANLQLIQIDFYQKANSTTTLAGQQKMVVDFVRIIEEEDTTSDRTP